ncbi:Ger(x)C family spore germination protein [Lysinibacillus sp. BW-2-10]|uniref:Ger(x)C family spore germination protein n=1 Tax=Lysinibacillus sp. BW-2-10 TaxID=2590030 RepID=UPI00117D81CD|nr:Ger(x)C family spore germination protein [Lysinibacillus sp. BW-2-10]TSI06026.1 Ger(x)C family spore germination protein [Lysinibacillus sp. BW-2-10]
MKRVYILGLLAIILLLSGCWNQTALDQRAFVVAIGLDKGEEEGETKLTYLISNPELSKQESGSKEPNNEILTFKAPDLLTARNLANTVVAKELAYNLLNLIIVSEDMAKDGEFVKWIYDVTKGEETSRGIPIIVTRENTSKFLLENDPKLETRIHKYFEFILKFGSENGFIPATNLHSYFRIMEASGDLFLAPYATTEFKGDPKNIGGEDDLIAGELEVEGRTNKTQFLGSALFKNGKMIGKLDAEETRLAIMLNDTIDMAEILATFPDPFNEKYRIGTRIMKKENNTVKMNLKKSTPTIDVTIPLYVDILSNHSMVNYGESPEKRKKLKTSMEDIIVKRINELIKKTQEDFKGQPFGWSLSARKQFKTIPEYEAYDWMSSYPNMDVKVNVNIIFGKFGRQSETPEFEEVKN